MTFCSGVIPYCTQSCTFLSFKAFRTRPIVLAHSYDTDHPCDNKTSAYEESQSMSESYIGAAVPKSCLREPENCSHVKQT